MGERGHRRACDPDKELGTSRPRADPSVRLLRHQRGLVTSGLRAPPAAGGVEV